MPTLFQIDDDGTVQLMEPCTNDYRCEAPDIRHGDNFHAWDAAPTEVEAYLTPAEIEQSVRETVTQVPA